jgi:hypothetical protein
MKIVVTSSNPEPTKQPYQTPMLEVHQPYNTITAGVSLPIGQGSLPNIDDVFNPEEIGL